MATGKSDSAGSRAPVTLMVSLAAAAGFGCAVAMMMILMPPGRTPGPSPIPPHSGDGAPLRPETPAAAAERIQELEVLVEKITADLERARAASEDPTAATVEPEAGPSTASDEPTDETPAPTTPELLAALARAYEDNDRDAARRISIELFKAMNNDREATLADILVALASDPSLRLQMQLSALLTHKKLELDPSSAREVNDALMKLVLEAEESASQAEAVRSLDALLKRYRDELELDPDDLRQLTGVMARPGDPGVRRAALELLGRHATHDPGLQVDLRSIARNEADPGLRVQALRTLRTSQGDGATDLFLEVLRQESEPTVLWEAASAANFLTQSAASTGPFKTAYRELIHREVSDLARGRAAQSLALLATLDGDATVPGDLRHLATTTSDARLAEFARTAAAQLESGEASIRSLGEAWKRWHRTLDREQYP